MGRKKNALRKHFVAPYTKGEEEPAEDGWLPLANYIETIEDDSEEDTDDQGFYDGDGTTESVFLGRSEKWNFEGSYNPEDSAQALIASMKRAKVDEERLIWHKIIETDGSTVIGVAKALEIKAGGGEATEYETFEGHLDFIKAPTVTPKA